MKMPYPAGETILIIDDELIVAMALAEDLEAMGFLIAGPYGNAEEAARNLDEDRPDAAVLDVNLGRDRTSFVLAEKLQDRGTPFLFLTGYNEVGDHDTRFATARRLGKPVSGKRVAENLYNMLAE